MQFTKPFKIGISEGNIRISFRRWKTPQAKPGGRYNIHPYGAIEVNAVSEVVAGDITEADARLAGFVNAEDLRQYLRAAANDFLTRVDFHFLGSVAVNQPDRSIGEATLTDLKTKLEAMERRAIRSGKGPWVWHLLRLISDHPGRRAAEHAAEIGWETPPLKAHVRRLKALGLTESLAVGYRLTERGRGVLDTYEP